jgi:hypothetical protein
MTELRAKKLRNEIALLSAGIALFALLLIEALPCFPDRAPLAFAISFSLMMAHWFFLASLIESVFVENPLIVFLRFTLAFLPLVAAIALTFVIGKNDRSLLVSVGLGVSVVPVATTSYSLFRGLMGFCGIRR